MGNFDDLPRIRQEEFFDHRTSAYDNERRLYDSLLAECFNIYGSQITYYAINFSTSANPIWGEDGNPSYERCFAFKGKLDLPREDNNTTPFGLEPFDVVIIHASKKHFEVASTYDAYGNRQPQLSPYKPKIGDLLKTKYNSFYYEIVDINHEEEMFLQHKHAWTFTVRPYKYEHVDRVEQSSLPFQQSDSLNYGNFKSNFGGW